MPRMGLNFQNIDGPQTFSFFLEHALSTCGILDLLRSSVSRALSPGPQGCTEEEGARKAWLCGARRGAERMGSHREAEMWRQGNGREEGREVQGSLEEAEK